MTNFDFTQSRQNAFDSFSESLESNSLLQARLQWDKISPPVDLIHFLRRIIGQEPSRVEESKNILESLRLNDIAYRFVQLAPLDYKSDFGILVCMVKATNVPYVVYAHRNRLFVYEFNMLSCRYEPQQLTAASLAERISKSVDVGVQVYAQLPWNLDNIRQLFNFTFFSRGRDILRILSTSVYISIIQLLLPIFTSSIFGTVVPSGDYQYLFYLFLLLIPLSFSLFIASYSRSRLLAKLESVVDLRLQSSMVNRLLRQPLAFLLSFSLADIVLRLDGISQIRRNITNSVLISAFGMVFGLANLGLMYYYEKSLTGFILAIYLIVAILIYRRSITQLLLTEATIEQRTSIYSFTTLLLDSIPQIRTTATEVFFLRPWSVLTRIQSDTDTKQKELGDSNDMLSSSAYQLTLTFLVAFAAYDFSKFSGNPNYLSITGLFPIKADSTGNFLAFIVAYAAFNSYFTQFVSTLTNNIVSTSAQWRKSSPLIYEPPEPGYRPGLKAISPSGRISFRSVSFIYNSKTILDNITFAIYPGQSIGITGPSGCGKSSFIRLISALYLPTSGEVLIDGTPINDLDLKSLRRSIGVVTQNTIIPATSIRDFLAPSFSFSDEQVWEALEVACLAKEIKNMPMMLDTLLSEGASNISGGQRQRLVLAKSILKKPSILLLDEATSALSESMQSRLDSNLSELRLTRISIAHRLSTLMRCDQINVLISGKIVESGTFDELLANNGYFRKSWNSQS
jgi:ATP-binding cassette subfamily B protein